MSALGHALDLSDVAVDLHRNRYGLVGASACVLTELSPAVTRLFSGTDRIGSCQHSLAQSGTVGCYLAYQKHTVLGGDFKGQ